MKKNGFTLIELLAVIAILGVILTITIISVTGIIGDSKKDSKNIEDKLIENAAELYISENSYTLKKEIELYGGSYLSVQTLIEQNYLKIKDTDTKNDPRYIKFKLSNDSVAIDNIIDATEKGTFKISGGVLQYNYEGFVDWDIIIPTIINNTPVTKIAGYCFWNLGITGIVIPNSVTYIGDYSFSGNQLKSVIIPNKVTYIGEYAFGGNSLENVIIPSSVTSIANYAFANNPLTKITIKGKDSLNDFVDYTGLTSAGGLPETAVIEFN